MKRAYFIGIAGKAMAPLAKTFKDMGWEVSGSDQKKVYPPITTYLEENNIPYFRGYRPENLSFVPDLVVVGRSALIIDPQNPEYLKAKNLGCPVLSYPEVLQKYLIKDNSIVVAGTYGKTTISAILAWILIKAGLNPSYMIGGIPLNMGDGVRITDSVWSVVEGDEPPALLESDLPKFMFYKPKYLILTAVRWDHPEIYKTEEDYLKSFEELVKLLPPNGMLVYNQDNVDEKIFKGVKCRKVSYSLNNSQADYFVKEVLTGGEITDFTVQTPKETLWLKTSLLGRHNLENICGAVALAREIGIEEKNFLSAVQTFRGVKTRLEFLGKFGGRYLYWDFAQHPE
ncbi:MAG: UDP-N-acetylmuramate--L-alanine ligase, partial [Microgenomates group bacterium]